MAIRVRATQFTMSSCSFSFFLLSFFFVFFYFIFSIYSFGFYSRHAIVILYSRFACRDRKRHWIKLGIGRKRIREIACVAEPFAENETILMNSNMYLGIACKFNQPLNWALSHFLFVSFSFLLLLFDFYFRFRFISFHFFIQQNTLLLTIIGITAWRVQSDYLSA